MNLEDIFEAIADIILIAIIGAGIAMSETIMTKFILEDVMLI